MEEYKAKRAQLIAQDRAGRLDNDRQFYTAASEKADKLVRQIRAAEAISVWGADSKAHDADDATHLFPGMAFLTGSHSKIKGQGHTSNVELNVCA